MAGFASKSITIATGAASFPSREVWPANQTIDGIAPVALGSGNFVDKDRWDDTIRSLWAVDILVNPETGTEDNLDTLTSTPAAVEGNRVILWAPSGVTIHVMDSTGNFKIGNAASYAQIDIVGPYSNACFSFIGGFWVETSRIYIAP
jgi:hypothetical protein